jgi:hypothetical protein
MNLADFKRSGDKTHARFVTHIADQSGDEKYELTLAGPGPLVRQVLAKAEIEVTIDSALAQEELRQRAEEPLAEQRKALWEIAALKGTDELFKAPPPLPQRDTSVLAAIRPVKGEGTPFFASFSTFTVPTGVSFFLFGSWVFNTFGVVRPTSGDQDLFLHLFGATGVVVSASVHPSLLPDVVAFALPPPFPFIPVFQIFGFATGVCGNFVAAGA